MKTLASILLDTQLGIRTHVYCVHCSQEISSKNYESCWHTELSECTTCRRITGIGNLFATPNQEANVLHYVVLVMKR